MFDSRESSIWKFSVETIRIQTEHWVSQCTVESTNTDINNQHIVFDRFDFVLFLFFSFVFLFFWLNWNENRISPSSRNNNKATRKDAPSACICTISTVFIVIIIIFSIVYVLRWCVLFRDVLRSTCICVCTLAVHFVFRLMREKSQINYR